MNGDSLIMPFKDFSPLSLMIKNFDIETMDFLLLLDNFQNSIGYNDNGDFSFTNKTDPSKITRNINSGLAFTGWQILNPNVVNKVDKNVFSLNYCYDQAIKDNTIWGTINYQKWLHIGTINALNEANIWLENYKE
jgi:MurNAc alpha-1-phosphate uridylyltransferase